MPGTPGGQWTEEEVAIVKSKLFDIMVNGGGKRSMEDLGIWTGDQWSRLPSAPKFLRLGFHDCLK